MLSLKGGVGKTTTTVGLGATLATLRGDRVIAVDANPDRGTLSDKVRAGDGSRPIRDLLNEREQISRYADVRAFTSQAPSRLEVLASDRDPAVSEAFSADDYRDVGPGARALLLDLHHRLRHRPAALGHGAACSAWPTRSSWSARRRWTARGARAPPWTGWRRTTTATWSATAVVVLSSVRPQEQEHRRPGPAGGTTSPPAAGRWSAIPYDPHLEEGAEIDLDRLQPATRDAYLRLAAAGRRRLRRIATLNPGTAGETG